MYVMRISITHLSPGATADRCPCRTPRREGGRRPISVADAPLHSPVVGIAAQRRVAACTYAVMGNPQKPREAVLKPWVACLRVQRRGRAGHNTSGALPGLLLHKCGRRRIGLRVRRGWLRRLPCVLVMPVDVVHTNIHVVGHMAKLLGVTKPRAGALPSTCMEVPASSLHRLCVPAVVAHDRLFGFSAWRNAEVYIVETTDDRMRRLRRVKSGLSGS